MEKKLWASVMLQAFEDLYDPAFKWSANEWFFNSRHRGIGSFHWICMTLDIDPNRTRNKIKKLLMKGS